jgi:hypothetical protein
MSMLVITGLVGIAMLVLFLGLILWWIKALPLIIIVVVVVALLIYDFILELRAAAADAPP